jgi:hypothetical protein
MPWRLATRLPQQLVRSMTAANKFVDAVIVGGAPIVALIAVVARSADHQSPGDQILILLATWAWTARPPADGAGEGEQRCSGSRYPTAPVRDPKCWRIRPAASVPCTPRIH